jgi:hypothetical protein
MTILDALEYPEALPIDHARAEFTQRLAESIERFTVREPEAFWLWHPIPNDPYRAMAQRQRPDLLHAILDPTPDDEEAALAVEGMGSRLIT